MRRDDFDGIAFEDSLSEDWSRDMETVELRLENRPTRVVKLLTLALVALVAGRVIYLNMIRGGYYTARAEANVDLIEHILAPRGLILDRNGLVLAQNRSVFSAILKVGELAKHPGLRAETEKAAQNILGVTPEELSGMIADAAATESSEPLVLAEDLSQSQVVQMKALTLSTLAIKDTYMRQYPKGNAFASLLGYVSLPTGKDLKQNPKLSSQDLVGKAGLELFYDDSLQGTPGAYVRVRDARGRIVHEEKKSAPAIGHPLTLSVDGEFQDYFAKRMLSGLQNLGRTTGGAVAINPQNGEILALMSFPAYDNNILSSPGHNDEKRAILNSPEQPLFDRMIGGNYSPGSTVKPLDSVALLHEHIIDPNRTIFSPGYVDVPNPYNPSQSKRYLDWRYQGDVNIYSAIAQSSDVYYYETVGGFKDVKEGLGITRLKSWWQQFGFGKPTGVDVPGEAKGFLPDPDWKKQRTGQDWLLGDTFNVAIGQGDLQVTPIQLINYITALANGGKLYQPHVTVNGAAPTVLTDLTKYAPEIKEVQKGMAMTVTSPMGTAYTMHDLGFPVAAKTGSAQIHNNTAENAFFVGYIPGTPGDGANSGSQFAVLILIEQAREGSLNAVPIAKDVFQWYYIHRLKK
jgi:penicillin-binding protein 2